MRRNHLQALPRPVTGLFLFAPKLHENRTSTSFRKRLPPVRIGAEGVIRMWRRYNPNPAGRAVGDCAVRAIAKALDTDWERAYAMITEAGYLMGDMPSSNGVWGAVLRQHGFRRYAIPNECPDCYTAKEFCNDHPRGVYVLGFGNHVATAQDGTLYDSWDSSGEIPQYYWTREE